MRKGVNAQGGCIIARSDARGGDEAKWEDGQARAEGETDAEKETEEGGLKIAARGSSHTGSRQDYIAGSSAKGSYCLCAQHPCHLTLHAFSVSFSIKSTGHNAE